MSIGDLTRPELRRHLEVIYNLPYAERVKVDRVLAALTIAAQTLATFRRHEMELHRGNEAFCKAVLVAIDGHPTGTTLKEKIGLRGLLGLIAEFGAGKGER